MEEKIWVYKPFICSYPYPLNRARIRTLYEYSEGYVCLKPYRKQLLRLKSGS